MFFPQDRDTMNWKSDFDWDGAIKHHSEALQGIIAALFAMLGEATISRLSRPVYYAVLRILRPAESAVRRLIVVAARGVVVKVAPSRPMPKGRKIGKGGGNRLPSFQLYDPRKYFAELSQRRIRYTKNPPRIHVFPYDSLKPTPQPVAAPAPSPDGLASAERITRRLHALKLALDDLPRQAKRLARARLRRQKAPTLKFKSPLRPGHPPGHRKTPMHDVDDVLAECHWLAWEAEKPDTS
jgi:hypothetical protein